MKKNKKATLADLEKRMSEWFSSYVAEHSLLPIGRKALLVLEVEHHESTHLYSSSIKVGQAYPTVSQDEMTENDWKVIFRLPIFRKAVENTINATLRDDLQEMRGKGLAIEMPYHHAQQINHIFVSNNLMYHVFKVSGSTTSPWRGKPTFMVYKKL